MKLKLQKNVCQTGFFNWNQVETPLFSKEQNHKKSLMHIIICELTVTEDRKLE